MNNYYFPGLIVYFVFKAVASRFFADCRIFMFRNHFHGR